MGKPTHDNNLSYYRKKKKLSIRQAALYTGCTDSRSLIDYEKGKKEPGLTKIARFALTYGASVPKLFPQTFHYAHREIVRLISLFGPKHYKNTIMVFYPGTYHTGVAIFIPAKPVIAFIRNMSPRRLGAQHLVPACGPQLPSCRHGRSGDAGGFGTPIR